MNKKGLSRLCSCFCLFAHRGICYGIACGGVLFLAIFVAVFGWSIAGAAAATAFSQFVGGAYPIIYFLRRNNSLLRRQMNDNRQMNIE